MQKLPRLLVLFPALFLGSLSPLGQTVSNQTNVQEVDNKLFEWCLSYFPDVVLNDGGPLERPVEKLAAIDMTGVVAPPGLITETEIVGDLPPSIKSYKGRWASPFETNPILPYAVFVERLSPTEMTIALLIKSSGGQQRHPPNDLRHRLKWDGQAFIAERSNLLGIEGVTFGVQVSPFGDAMVLSWSDDREAHLLTCLMALKHF
jgi:hypothetical protein